MLLDCQEGTKFNLRLYEKVRVELSSNQHLSEKEVWSEGPPGMRGEHKQRPRGKKCRKQKQSSKGCL